MCDKDDLARWAREGLTRRQLGAIGAAGAASACTPIYVDRPVRQTPLGLLAASSDEVRGVRVAIPTPDGTMQAEFEHLPTGRHPAVILWPDIAAPRTAMRMLARRLAAEGYAVLVPNPFYRDAPLPIWKDFADFSADNGFEKVKPWRAKLTPEAVMRDATAAIGWLDAQPQVDTARGIGTQGYCMGGALAVWTAAGIPDRVRAVASFHGGGLVRPDDSSSPDKMLHQTQASFLFAIAQNDDAKAPGDKDVLSAAAAGHTFEIEVYPANHGWCVPDSPSYNAVQAERGWKRLQVLYKSTL